MAKAKTIKEYLASVPATHRPALKKLYGQMKKLYPSATEHKTYGMPLLKYHGHPLGGFCASKNHLSLFVWSGTALKTLGKKLDKYDTGMGTVRFPPNKPLPLTLVKAILSARAKEIKKRWG